MKKNIPFLILAIMISCKKESSKPVSEIKKASVESKTAVHINEAPVATNTDSISLDTKVDLSKSLTKATPATKEEMDKKIEELKSLKPTEKKKLVDILPKSIFGMPVEVAKEIVFDGVPSYPSAEGYYVNKENIQKSIQLYIVDVGGTADGRWKIQQFYKQYNGEIDKNLPPQMRIFHEDINGMKSVITKTTKDNIDYYSSQTIVKERYTVDIAVKGFEKADLVKIISNLDFSGLE